MTLDIVTWQNNIACIIKVSKATTSNTSTSSTYINFKSSTSGLRYTFMSFPSCFGPDIIIDNIMYFLFMQSPGDKF